jgi:hypothetical protein
MPPPDWETQPSTGLSLLGTECFFYVPLEATAPSERGEGQFRGRAGGGLTGPANWHVDEIGCFTGRSASGSRSQPAKAFAHRQHHAPAMLQTKISQRLE